MYILCVDFSGSWMINGQRFSGPQRLPQQYGVSSVITPSLDLIIARWDTIGPDQLRAYYKAENPYGAVKSRTINIIKPCQWYAC